MSIVLGLVFPMIVAAAIALAYYGYLYADAILRSSEASLREDNRQLVDDLAQAIQERIDGADIALVRRIEVVTDAVTGERTVNLREGKPPGITSFVVLDERHAIVDRKNTDRSWSDDLRSLKLDWGTVKPQSFRHLHQWHGGNSVLIAYGHMRTESGETHFWAAQHDLNLIARVWLPEALAGQRGGAHRRLVVLDEQGNTRFGDRLPRDDDRFLYETSFGKTLYAWRVQVAPKDVVEMQAQEGKRRLFLRAFIPIAVFVIAVGLAVVALAVRAERRASRLRGDFMANVSHELKTPLSLVRMFGELIATGRHKGDAGAREYAAIITRESERLSHLIDNVLDFARLERGKASYDFAEGDLRDVVERALDVCRYRLEREKMLMHTEIAESLPRVRMDENAMTLVLLNLVDNAVKYAAEGGEVRVSVERAPGGVVLGVADKGPGVPVDERARVFDRFYRARDARERNIRGSGIGLALVKHIAEAHGGHVTIDSEPGRGACFRVWLPASPRAAAEGEGTPSPVVTPSPAAPPPASLAGEGTS